MKIKCDGVTPKCGTCRKRALHCVFTAVEKPQKPRKREEYVKALESRLSRIETLVRASGILDENGGRPAGLQSQPQRQPAVDHLDCDGFDLDSLLAGAGLGGAGSAKRSRDGSEGDLSQKSSRSCRHPDLSRKDYWGLASRNSKRPGWINDIIEDVVSRGLSPSPGTSPESTGEGNSPFSQYKKLPPVDEVLALVADFFANVNALLPLYHEESFMAQFYKNISTPANQSMAWWASLNTVLALAHIARSRSTFLPQEQEKHAWQYMKNALAIQKDSPALDFDMLSVQALVGMALFFQITSFNSQMPSMVLATAVRVAHGIGLHVNCEDPNVSVAEKEQRRRVFWATYILDREISLRTGRPPVHDDDDIDLDLPQDSPPDNAGYTAGANILRSKCVLAQIQGKVYKQLYANQSWSQPRAEILAAVGSLDRELEEWRLTLPTGLRPNTAMAELPAPHNSYILTLHFCYWYCFSLIHRRYAICVRILGSWPADAVPESISPSTPGSAVVAAARRVVQLVRDHPPFAKGTRWYLLYYCAAALVTLFGNVIQDPAAATAEEDLARIGSVLAFLALICEEDNRDAHSLFGLCLKLERIAIAVLQRSGGEGSRRGEDLSPDAGRKEIGAKEKEEWGREIQKQLHFHGRFFSPLDV